MAANNSQLSLASCLVHVVYRCCGYSPSNDLHRSLRDSDRLLALFELPVDVAVMKCSQISRALVQLVPIVALIFWRYGNFRLRRRAAIHYDLCILYSIICSNDDIFWFLLILQIFVQICLSRVRKYHRIVYVLKYIV